MNLKGLLKFHKERSSVTYTRAKPRPSLAKALWSMWRMDEEDPKKLKELYASSRRLEELMSQPGWQDILSAKAFYTADSDAKSKNVSVDDKARFAAAVEWTTLEGFFKELNLRIKAGKDSYQKLNNIGVKDL